MLPQTTILLPLYLYPLSPTNTPTWTFLFTTLANYPSLSINIIINQNSGPTPISSNGCPIDTNYLAAIANLTAFPNARLLGYSHVEYGERDIGEVKDEIGIYNNFSLCPTDIRLDGLFFDEAPQNFNDSTSVYMSSITSFARNISRTTTGKPFFPIIFNPGTPADIGFFGIADNIVEREDVGSEGYDVGEVIDSIPEGERGNSTVIAYDWVGLTKERQTEVVDTLVGAGIGGLFVTQTEYDAVDNDTLWSSLLEALNRATNVSQAPVL